MSIADFCRQLQSHERRVSWVLVAKKSARRLRPTFTAPIGAKLRALRESRHLSVQQVVNLANAPQALTWNKLTWIEAGRVQFPDAGALRAIASVYDLTYADLVWQYVKSGYGLQTVSPDLLSHTPAAEWTLPDGGVSDSASTRVQQRPEDNRETYADALSDVVARLTVLSTDIREDRAASAPAPRSRRSYRKTR